MDEEAFNNLRSEHEYADRERERDRQEEINGGLEEPKKTLMELMMGEEYHKYFWDEKHSL